MKTAMKLEAIERVFKFQQLELPDVNPSDNPEAVKRHYAVRYPSLTNAAIEGPSVEGGKMIYTFVTSVGAKG